MKSLKFLLIALLAVGFLAGTLNAQEQEDQGKRGKGKDRGQKHEKGGKHGEIRKMMHEFKKSVRTKAKSHFQQQKKENQDLKKSLKDKGIDDKLAALKTHSSTQNSENLAFIKTQYEAAVEYINQKATENKLPEEVKSKILEKAKSHYEKRKSEFEKFHQELIAFLDKLAADSKMSEEEKRKALKDQMQTLREKFKQAKGGRGKHGGKRGKGAPAKQKSQDNQKIGVPTLNK